jgi:hypothetical protein
MFYLNAQKLPGFSMHEMQCTHLLPLFYNLQSWDITEDYEDEIDVDEEFEDEEADEDVEADEDMEADKDGEADEDGGETAARSDQADTTHTEEPPAADAAGDGQGGVTVPIGINTCGICNKKEKHNSRTCPWKDEILQRQLAERQQGTATQMVPSGKRTCGLCGQIKGHNARSCMRRQIEAQLKNSRKRCGR